MIGSRIRVSNLARKAASPSERGWPRPACSVLAAAVTVPIVPDQAPPSPEICRCARAAGQAVR
jgi:hypothetical protein